MDIEYTYDRVMHQIGRKGDTVLETMYSHALGEKVVIMRVGNQLSFSLVSVDSNKLLYAFHDVLPEGY